MLNFKKRLKTLIKGLIQRGQNTAGDHGFSETVVLNNNYVKIGEGCYIYQCQIGDYTYLSKNVSVMNTKIGKFCSIAQGVSICLGRHPSSKFVSTHPAFFSVNRQNGMTFSDREYFAEMGKTVIGHDVWIGVNAIIMDDINIGNGAIIAAGAVVTKDVPPYGIVAGIPARLLRYRFEPQQISFLENFQWWNKDEAWLREHFTTFHDIELFMKKYADR